MFWTVLTLVVKFILSLAISYTAFCFLSQLWRNHQRHHVLTIRAEESKRLLETLTEMKKEDKP